MFLTTNMLDSESSEKCIDFQTVLASLSFEHGDK